MEKIEMGNQQVTDCELGWLAGILDGEGHISMKTSKFKNEIHCGIEIGITNTSQELLKKVTDICSRLGVNMRWMSKKIPERYFPCWTIATTKISHCYKILNPILTMLTSKHDRANLLYSFCERRLLLATKCKNDKIYSANKNSYASEDLWFFEEFKKLYRNSVTSTTIPSGSRVQENSKLGTDNISLMI